MRTVFLCLALVFVTASFPDDALAFHEGVTGNEVVHGIAYTGVAAAFGFVLYMVFINGRHAYCTRDDFNPTERYALTFPPTDSRSGKGPRKAKVGVHPYPTYASLRFSR